MHPANKFMKFASVISNLSGYASVIGIVLLLGIIVTEIVLRSLFRVSLEFNITVSMWLLVLIVWMGAPFALKNGAHIQVTLITSLFPRKLQICFNLLLAFVGMSFFLYFSWQAWGVCYQNYTTGVTGESIWHIPKWYGWLPFCIGSSLLDLQFAGLVIENLLFLLDSSESHQGDGS